MTTKIVKPMATRRSQLHVLLLINLILLLSTDVAAFQEGGSGPSTIDVNHILSTLNIWVMILAIFVTVVIAASAFNIFNQYYQAGKFGERVKADLIAQMDKEITQLKETYKLVQLKPPAEILKDAQNDYMPLLEMIRAAVERQHLELNSAMTKSHSELQAAIELNKQLIEEMRRVGSNPIGATVDERESGGSNISA